MIADADTEQRLQQEKSIGRMANDINEMNKALQKVVAAVERVPELQQVTQQLTLGMERLATLVETLPERCPHREAIARGANNIERVKKVELNIKAIEKSVEDEKLSRVKETAKILLIAIAGGGSTVAIERAIGLFF